MAKQPNLTAIRGKTAEASARPRQTAPEKTAKPKRHPDKVQATLYLPKPVHKALKLLAIERETNVHALVMEGVDKVLKEYGSKTISQLTGQE